MSTPYGCLRGSSRTARHTCSRMRGGGRTLPCSTKGSYSGHSAACRACKAPTGDTRHEHGLPPVPPRPFGRRHAVGAPAADRHRLHHALRQRPGDGPQEQGGGSGGEPGSLVETYPPLGHGRGRVGRGCVGRGWVSRGSRGSPPSRGASATGPRPACAARAAAGDEYPATEDSLENASFCVVSNRSTGVFAVVPDSYNASPESNSIIGLFALSSSAKLAVKPFAVAVASSTDL